MENPIVAPASGKISEVNVSSGKSVKSGDMLVVIET
jgi:biotin carboxyl carrier protein